MDYHGKASEISIETQIKLKCGGGGGGGRSSDAVGRCFVSEVQQRKTDRKLAPTVMRWSCDRSFDAVGALFRI